MVQQAPYHRVLIVEDIEPVQNAFFRLLSRVLPDAELERASDGLDAASQIAAAVDAGRPFDLCVVDQNLPHLTGLELVERIRQSSESVPVFLLTSGRLDSDVRAQAEQLGVPCLNKPFTAAEFEHVLAEHAASAPARSDRTS